MSPTRKRQIEKKKVTTLYKNTVPFAKGFFARVYLKTRRYPSIFFRDKGEIVRVYRERTAKEAKAAALSAFYELKIINTLFPKHTIPAKAVRWNGREYELHMQLIPLHKELEEYMQIFTKDKSTQYAFDSEEYSKCKRVFNKNYPKIRKVIERMQSLGIRPGIENATNISFAGKIPILIEPKLRSKSSIREYILNQIKNEEEREKLLEWLSKINVPERPPKETPNQE